MRSLLLVPALVVLMGCGNAATNAGKTDSPGTSGSKSQSKNSYTPVSKQLTAFAHFVAGIPDDSSALKAVHKRSWQTFSKNTAEKWKVLDERIGSEIEGWVKSHPQEVKNEPSTLFYPFAGGDFYYANLFFPKQDTIIMIGLEPGGSIFDPDKLSDSTLVRYYGNLEHTMFFPHRLGFFRTKSMVNDFKRGPLNGTLHTVLFYMARFGYNVHYISHFNINENGKDTQVLDATEMKTKTKRMAYRVGYSIPGSNEVREVVYISYDASDGYLKQHPGLMRWLGERKKVVTFFKAASYLMHEEYFSTVRNYVKDHTVRLMQDDSGLPYKFMLDNGFNVTLFGEYTHTIQLFAGRFQPDLKKAYAQAKPEKLPFLIGYNAEFKECNLQAAVKR